MSRFFQYLMLWVSFYVGRNFRNMPPEAIEYLKDNYRQVLVKKKWFIELRLIDKIIKINEERPHLNE